MKRGMVPVRNGWRRRLALAGLAALLCLAAGSADVALAATTAPAARGDELFHGGGFENGGPACGACHAVGSTGGARLGPRLDRVGTSWTPDAIAAWLSAPPTPTMAALFGQASGNALSAGDRAALGAYLTAAASKAEAANAVQANGSTVPDHGLDGGLVAYAVLLAAILLGAAAVTWRGRVRSVRARLVRDARLRSTTRSH